MRFDSWCFYSLKHWMWTHLCSPMGQSFLLQLSLSLALPIHLLPPYWGRGLLHSRVLVLTPPPHVTEQVAHGDQGPQPPSTIKTRKKMETELDLSENGEVVPQISKSFVSHCFNTLGQNLISSFVECGAWCYEGETGWAYLGQCFLSGEERRSAQNTWGMLPRGQPWCMKMFGCLPGMQR